MAHGDVRKGKWRGNWRMQWVASTLHTPSEHGVSSITADDAPTSAASSRLNWRPSHLNGLVRFSERWILVSACVSSHFNWPLRTFRLNHTPSIFCPQFGSSVLLLTKFQSVTLLKTDLCDYSPRLRLAASWKWGKFSACGSCTGRLKTVRLRCEWTVYNRVVCRFVEPTNTVRHFIHFWEWN